MRIQAGSYLLSATSVVVVLSIFGVFLPAALIAAEQGSGALETAPPAPAVELSTDSALPPPSPSLSEGDAELSLQGAIITALRNNLDIRVLGFEPRISGIDVQRQWSPFDPTFTSGISYLSRKSPDTPLTTVEVVLPFITVNSSETRTDSKTTSYRAAISDKTTFGTIFSIGSVTSRNDLSTVSRTAGGGLSQFQEYYDSDLAFQVLQPLLKNAGRNVNTAFIRIAQNNARSTTHQFENNVMNLVLNISNSYWALVFAREDLTVREKSLQAAQDLLKNNVVKYEAGALPKIEVTRARSRVADREEAVVNGKALIKDAEDRLRGLLDSRDLGLLGTGAILPTDEPGVHAEQIDLNEAVRIALVRRPDIRQQQLAMESFGIALVRAKHQLLPVLDLDATYNVNGLDRNFSDSLSSTSSLDNADLSLGLSFALPIGNRLARSDYMRSYYERLQSLANYELLQRDITLAVKKAVRDIATSLQRIETNRARKQFADENVEAEIQKYEVGQSISLNVLDAQEQLQQAESDYLRSVVGFNASMDTYYYTTGLILQKYGVQVLRESTITRDSETLFK